MKLQFLVELELDENHPQAATPDQILEDIQDHLVTDDAKAAGIKTESVSVMPYPLP